MTELETLLVVLLSAVALTFPMAGHAIGYAKGVRAARSRDYRDGYSDGYRHALGDIGSEIGERGRAAEAVTRPSEVVPVSVDGDEGEPWPPKPAVDVRRPE